VHVHDGVDRQKRISGGNVTSGKFEGREGVRAFFFLFQQTEVMLCMQKDSNRESNRFVFARARSVLLRFKELGEGAVR
jgi:hypothetical protein